MNDLQQLTDRDRKQVRFVSVGSTLPFNVGSIQLMGSVVALPDYLNVTSVQDFNSKKLNATLRRDFDWEMPDDKLWFTSSGQLLVDSFLLSPKAKKYLISRELNSTDSYFIHSHAGLVFMSIYLFMLVLGVYENKANQPYKNLSYGKKMSAIVLGASVAISAYWMLILVYKSSWQRHADAKALTRGLKDANELLDDCEKNEPSFIDEEYLEGAFEYYNKLCQRHLALKQLIKSTTEWYQFKHGTFSSTGDMRSSLLSVELPLSHRLESIRKWSRDPSLNKPQPKQKKFSKEDLEKHIESKSNIV
jgi:hypothetical protein